MTIPWWCWGVLANLCVAYNEYTARVGGHSSYLGALLHSSLFISILVTQMGIFYCWKSAPSMMLAWAVFTVGNTVIRLASVQWAVREPPNWATIGGVLVMVAGAFVVKLGTAR